MPDETLVEIFLEWMNDGFFFEAGSYAQCGNVKAEPKEWRLGHELSGIL
jgi:hypothetical protein